MIDARVAVERLGHRRDEHLGGFVAVAVAVHTEATPVERADEVGHLVGRDQPQTIARVTLGRPVVVRPGDARREPLDGTVEDDLDDPEPELLARLPLEVDHEVGQIVGVGGVAEPGRPGDHHPCRVVGISGH